MTQHSHSGQPTTLDPLTRTVILETMLDALPAPPGTSAEQIAAVRAAATTLFLSLRPRTPLEAMLAARIAGAFFAEMECARRAELNDMPEPLRVRLRACATAVTRMGMTCARELLTHQKAPLDHPADAAAEAPPPNPQPHPAPTVTTTPAPAKSPANPPRMDQGSPITRSMTSPAATAAFRAEFEAKQGRPGRGAGGPSNVAAAAAAPVA